MIRQLKSVISHWLIRFEGYRQYFPVMDSCFTLSPGAEYLSSWRYGGVLGGMTDIA